MKTNLKYGLFFVLISIYANAEVLVFSKAYQLALENANSIKASVFMAESTKERIAQEESRLYPQVNLSAYYKKSEYKYNPTYNNSGTTIDQGLINYSLSVKQSVYNAETYSRIDLETSRSELEKIGVELQKEQLAQEVFKVYLDLLKTHNKIELHKSYIQYSKSKLDELEKRYEMRMANKMDLLEMRVEYKSAQIDLTKEKKFLKVLDLKLKKLIGDIEYELPYIESNKPISQTLEKMKASVQNISDFSSNLNLLQARLTIKLTNQEIENAYNAHYPRVDLEASYAMYDTDDPTNDSLYENVKNVMLVLNVPIYSGGHTSSKVRESKLRNKSANEELINTTKEIKVQYDEYLAMFEASAESVSMYKDAYESSLVHVDAVEQGYNHGLKSIIDLNDAKTKQYEVKYKYIENIYEMVDSYIGLLIVANDFEHIELLDNLVK